MNPELKAYLDEWQAEHQRDFKIIRANLDAIRQSLIRTSDCLRHNSELLAPVTASSGATKLATVSAREAQRPALVPAIGEPPVLAPAAPMKTIVVAPASCSTECAAQATPASSTELAHDKDAVEHGIYDDSIPSPTAELVTVSSRTAARPAPVTNIIIVAPVACSTECRSSGANELTPASTPAAAPMTPTATINVIPVLTAAAGSDGTFDDEAIKGAASMITTSSSGSPHRGISASVCEFILSAPPSLFSAPTAPTSTKSLQLDTGQVALCSSSLPCVENIEVEVRCMVNIIPDDTGADQRPPWPPPDPKVLCSNHIHSLQLTNAIVEAHSSGYAPSFLKIYLVNAENQKTPCLCEVIPGAIPYGPAYFRWEIAWVLVVSSCADIGNASDLATTASTLDAYAKAWERPKDPSDLEYYLKAHYCHDVQLQTAMQDAPSGLEEMLICDEYAEDQPESQQLTKFSSEPSKGFSDCEGLPVCTHNIFVCWESDIVPPPYPYMSRCDNSKSRPIPWPSFADLSRGVHITEPRPPLQGTWGEFFSVVELHCFSYGLSGISPLPMCLQWSRPIESVCKLSGKIIQAGLGPPEEYLFVWLQPKPPWSYILIKIDAEVEERGVHLRVAEITSVQLILFKLPLPVGICLYELPLPGYSLYSSSFGSASEELFRESKKLEFNNWVSYMLEQYNYISTCGINTELQSLCECTNRPLMQAVGIPDSNKQMQLCMAARGLFILQNQGHRWMSHEFAPLCYCYTTLLAAQGADTDGIVIRKQYRVLVPCTEVPWDPDGSTWCRWFSTSTEHGPFQGGRNAIFVTKFFEQVFAGNKHYIDFNQVHASDNYYLGTSFVWVPASHENCSYLIQIYPNFVYCSDSNQIKDRRLQWDPGGFSVMSAWGQAEFQGGRDVRNLTWVQHVGLPSWASKDGLGPANPPRRTAATYTLQEVTNRISKLDQDETAAALLSHLRAEA